MEGQREVCLLKPTPGVNEIIQSFSLGGTGFSYVIVEKVEALGLVGRTSS